MSIEGDRRAAGAARMPFDALVEVGGELGPAFEAQAIDISEEGMHLRTAYLPEVGQPLTFRFDAGPAQQIAVGGEVTWKQELGRGGEFGVRFVNLDGETVAALGRVLGMGGPPGVKPAVSPGARVRLHIDGLGSPMRARVKESGQHEVTAFSELGFLQVGKQLELEDAQTGNKRPACIDKVDVEVDPESRVPQLVVTLRYDDEIEVAEEPAQELAEDTDRPLDAAPVDDEPAASDEPAEAKSVNAPIAEPAAARRSRADDDISIEEASNKMKGAFARGASQVGPALNKVLGRAKVTMALLAAKRRALKEEIAPLRRTTAPPPGGALHAAGRKVVRGEPDMDAKSDVAAPEKKKLVTKRRVAVAAAVGASAMLAMIALHKPAAQAPLASAPPPDTAAPADTAPTAPAPMGQTGPMTPPAPAPDPMTSFAPTAPLDPTALSSAAKDDKEAHAPKKAHVAPFGNGPVAHGNVLHLKMDGAIEKIEGASQPTGFTVVIPERRSLEAAGPLAARDGRIASIRVSNDPNGAELSVAFKDGVPNYQVRARGDVLEIALAPIGAVADARSASHGAQAKHDAGKAPHGKAHKPGGKHE